MADQDIKLLKDTEDLVRAYNTDTTFKHRVDELISYPGATYKNRPLRLYVLTITRLAPQYKEYERISRQDPQKMSELFDNFYHQGPFSKFTREATADKIYSEREKAVLERIEQRSNNAQEQYTEYNKFVYGLDQNVKEENTPSQSETISPTQSEVQTTPIQSKPVQPEIDLPTPKLPGENAEHPQVETFFASGETEKPNQSTLPENPTPIPLPQIKTAADLLQPKNFSGKLSSWVKNAGSSTQIFIKKFSSRYLSSKSIGNFLAEIGSTILGTGKMGGKPGSSTPADEANVKGKTSAIGQSPALNNALTDAKIFTKKAITRFATPERLSSVFSGTLGAVVGGGVTNSWTGAAVGGVVGAATPIAIRHGGGGPISQVGNNLLDIGSGVARNAILSRARMGAARLATKVFFATPAGRIIMIVGAVLIFILMMFFVVNLPKSSAPFTPYILTESGPEIPALSPIISPGISISPQPIPSISPPPEGCTAAIVRDFGITMIGFDETHACYAWSKFYDVSRTNFTNLVRGAVITAIGSNASEQTGCITINLSQYPKELFDVILIHELSHAIGQTSCVNPQLSHYNEFLNVWRQEGGITAYSRTACYGTSPSSEDYAEMLAYYLNPYAASQTAACAGRGPNPYANGAYPLHYNLARTILGVYP